LRNVKKMQQRACLRKTRILIFSVFKSADLLHQQNCVGQPGRRLKWDMQPGAGQAIFFKPAKNFLTLRAAQREQFTPLFFRQ
jgi:hypothetical protein